jgi:hypothetical protein
MNITLIRRYWVLLLVLPGLFGCTTIDSVRNKMKDRIVGVPPRVRTVESTPEKVYQAARQTMEEFGYHFTEGGPAQGRLEGFTRVSAGDSFKSARQRGIKIQLRAIDGGQVDIEVMMTEVVEEDTSRTSMPATESPVRDATAYDTFFDAIERRLKLPPQGQHQQ